MPGYICSVCRNYSCSTYSAMLYHISRDHKHEPYVLICGITGCPSRYTNVESLRTHIRRNHAAVLTETSRDSTFSVDCDEEDNHMVLGEEEERMDVSEVQSEETGQSSDMYVTRAAALYILRMREVKHLAQDTIDDLIYNTKDLITNSIERDRQQVMQILSQAGITTTDIPGLREHMEDLQSTNPFEKLGTEYNQTKYFQKYLGLLVSVYTHVYMYVRTYFR